MKKYQYMFTVDWSEEDGGYGITVPELSGCFSFAKNLKDVGKQVQEAIETWMEAAKESKLEIPEPMATKPRRPPKIPQSWPPENPPSGRMISD